MILSSLLGVIVGYLISHYLNFINVKILGFDPKYILVAYDASSNRIVDYNYYLDNKNSFEHSIVFRIVIKKFKASETISFNFTNCFYKGNEISLKHKCVFEYYSLNSPSKKYYIDLYKKKDYQLFIDEIFYIPKPGFTATTSEETAKEVLKKMRLSI